MRLGVAHERQVDEALDRAASKLEPDPLIFAARLLFGRMRRPVDAHMPEVAESNGDRTLALELDKILPQDRNIVVDGGNFLGVVPYLSVPDPGCFKMIGDFASIGLGFGAALGVAKARPGKTTVLNAILGLTTYQGELKVLGRDPWAERDQLMRAVCFISDVAVLPRWIRVSQAVEYVAGVHPRFDRAKAEGLLEKTTIKRTSKVKELSKGMVVQLHLALVMALWIGQRQGDLLALQWDAYDGTTIRLTRSKSKGEAGGLD